MARGDTAARAWPGAADRLPVLASPQPIPTVSLDREDSPRALVPSRDLPLATRLELGPFPGAVPCARIHARLVALEWGLARLAEDAELIVSELVTNAITATGRPITLFLRSDRSALVIEVWDAVTEPPRHAPHAIDAESGRGLELVTLLSDRWGIFHPETGGKVIWALLAATTQ